MRALEVRHPLVIPELPSDDAIAPMMHDWSARVIAEVRDCDDLHYAEHIRQQWAALIGAVGRRSRKGLAAAHAAARLTEVAVGRLINNTRLVDLGIDMNPTDYAYFKRCGRFPHVVDDVISGSTNDRPATRHAVDSAIRKHREAIGDLATTRPRVKRSIPTRSEMAAFRRWHEAQELARSSDASKAYGLIRQALAALPRHSATAESERSRCEAALTDAEDWCVQLMRAERGAS